MIHFSTVCAGDFVCTGITNRHDKLMPFPCQGDSNCLSVSKTPLADSVPWKSPIFPDFGRNPVGRNTGYYTGGPDIRCPRSSLERVDFEGKSVMNEPPGILGQHPTAISDLFSYSAEPQHLTALFSMEISCESPLNQRIARFYTENCQSSYL